MPQPSQTDNNDITSKSADFEFEPLPPAPNSASDIDYGRRIKLLMAAIFVVTLAYSAAWYWFGNKLVGFSQAAMSNFNLKGQTIQCDDPKSIGYPFRLGLSCAATGFTDPAGNLKLEAGAFRSAAQVYKPDHIIAELDGPLNIASSGNAPIGLTWTLARASINGISGLPQRISLEIEKPQLAQTGGVAANLGLAEFAAFHMRQGVNNQVDLASNIDAVTIQNAPAFNLSADAFVSGATRFHAALSNGRALIEILRGNDGELRNATLAFADGGKVSLSGPFSFSATGHLTATLSVKAENAGILIDNLGKLGAVFHADTSNLAVLKAMAVSDQIRMIITIIEGNASMGFIPIGTIPPL